MKRKSLKHLLAIAVWGFALPSSAQVFACQYTDSNGFHFDNGRWKRSSFNVRAPFFLRLQNGKITEESAASPMNGVPAVLKCVTQRSYALNDTLHTCSDESTQLIFSLNSRSGAVSNMLGAASSNAAYRDSVSVALFNCQHM